jgi:adenosylcobinamide kinase/adenosylcobinamide-phosphate guanylyltransferase
LSSACASAALPARLPLVTLVLGGARSGKSLYAEQLIGERGPGLYLATAKAGDHEMAERIRTHRARRGPAWETLEEPLDLSGAIARYACPDRPILVDCLTLWLSNLLGAERDVDAAIHDLLAIMERPNGPLVLVSNEVGFGIVPATPLGRIFRDHAGRLNQAVAAIAVRVVLVAAGLPLLLKDVAPAKSSTLAKDQAS